MKKTYLCALATSLLMASCGNSEKQNQKNDQDTLAGRDTAVVADGSIKNELDTAELSFFNNAAIGGLTEVEFGSRMLAVSRDSAVKQFARMMVADHSKANKALESLAASMQIGLPHVLPDAKLAIIKKLDAFRSDGLNEYYAHTMVEDHKNTIDLFNRAAGSGNVQISSFAKKTLPILEHHYKMAKDLETKITSHKANQGDDPLKLSDAKSMSH